MIYSFSFCDMIKPQSAKSWIFMFYPLQIVSRYRDPQLKCLQKCLFMCKLNKTKTQSCKLNDFFEGIWKGWTSKTATEAMRTVRIDLIQKVYIYGLAEQPWTPRVLYYKLLKLTKIHANLAHIILLYNHYILLPSFTWYSCCHLTQPLLGVIDPRVRYHTPGLVHLWPLRPGVTVIVYVGHTADQTRHGGVHPAVYMA